MIIKPSDIGLVEISVANFGIVFFLGIIQQYDCGVAFFFSEVASFSILQLTSITCSIIVNGPDLKCSSSWDFKTV